MRSKIGKNAPNCIILDRWVFDSFILADEPLVKALWSVQNCVSVNNNLYGKLVLSLDSRNTIDERFKVTSVPFLFLTLTY